MHTVEILEEAVAMAERLGYRIRQDWLEGSGGGGCQIKGENWIFLDLSQNPVEQLAQVADVLRGAHIPEVDLSPELSAYLQLRKSA